MIGALIEMDKNGRVRSVYIIADDESQQAIVEGALTRITKPSAWRWLRMLFRGRR